MPGAADLLIHLTPCPIIMVVGGQEFVIPAMDAVGWVRAVTATPLEPYRIFPILAGPDAVDAVDDALWNGILSEEDLLKMGLEAIGVAADRPWWVALRLISSVSKSWNHLHVNHAAGMSFAGWLDEVWSKAIALMDPKHRASWEHEIDNPPKGWETDVDFNEEEKAFMAAMRAVR